MPPVAWTDSLAIGVSLVDGQHRELFDRVAAFEVALERGDPRPIAETFAFLREYTIVHFADEEQLMVDAGYPWLDDHREAHIQFAERLAALVRERETSGTSAFLALRARNWIVVWLLDHVGHKDQQLGRFLRARAA